MADIKSTITKALARVLSDPSDDADVPRPVLGQAAVVGEARFVSPAPMTVDKDSKNNYVMAHRIDRVTYRDLDRVRWYPIVVDCLQAIVLPIIRANFHFECADQDLADLAGQDLSPMIRGWLENTVRGGLNWGYQTAEKVWEIKFNTKVSGSGTGTGPIEKIYPYVWSLKRFAYMSPEDTILLIRPRTGEFAGVRQYSNIYNPKDQDVLATKLTHWAHLSEFNSVYGFARTKAAVPFVEMALGLYNDAALYYARFAAPTLIGYAPAQLREIGRDSNGTPIMRDNLKTMANALNNVRSASAIVFPMEYDQTGKPKWMVQPLEIGERGTYTVMTDHLNGVISAAMGVAQLATSTAPANGTYNLGQTQIDLMLQNEEALLDSLKDVIDRDICDQYRIYNFGNDAPPLRIVFEPLSTDVLNALLQGLIQNLVMGSPLYSKDGKMIMVDWAKLATDKGVPVIMEAVGKQGPDPTTAVTNDPAPFDPAEQGPESPYNEPSNKPAHALNPGEQGTVRFSEGAQSIARKVLEGHLDG